MRLAKRVLRGRASMVCLAILWNKFSGAITLLEFMMPGGMDSTKFS